MQLHLLGSAWCIEQLLSVSGIELVSLAVGLELELVMVMKHLKKIIEMQYCVVIQSIGENHGFNIY